MPPPALTRSDIEVIRGKTNRTGRNYGGPPPPYGNNNGRHRGGYSGGYRGNRESYNGRNRDNQRFEPHHNSPHGIPQSGRWQSSAGPAFDVRANSSTAANARHQQGWSDNTNEYNGPGRRAEDFGTRPPYGGGHWHGRDHA